MSEINWSLLNPVDTGAAVQQGFATGMAMVKEIQTRNALRSYLANPDDEHAYSALAFYDPQAAASIQEQRQRKLTLETAMEGLRTKRDVGALVASGDIPGAKAKAAASGDFELVDTLNKMGDAERKATIDRYTGAAPIAYQASKLPYERRKEFLAAAAPELQAMGWTPDQLAAFDPNDANLAAIVGTGSKLSELVAADKPQIVPFVPGGGVAAYQNGQVTTLIQPNDTGQPTGAPVVTTGGGGGGAGGITSKNNPGALRKPGSKEFETFATPAEGIAKQEALLGRYMGRGLNNVRSIVERYAPRKSKGGDNTDAQVNNYIGYVAKRLGVNPNDAISPAVVPQLAAAMREFETGKRASGTATASAHSPAEIKAAAQRAIAAGADPAQVKARAAAQGVAI